MSLQIKESENIVSADSSVRNITINRLSTRTWNRLKMNEAYGKQSPQFGTRSSCKERGSSSCQNL